MITLTHTHTHTHTHTLVVESMRTHTARPLHVHASMHPPLPTPHCTLIGDVAVMSVCLYYCNYSPCGTHTCSRSIALSKHSHVMFRANTIQNDGLTLDHLRSCLERAFASHRYRGEWGVRDRRKQIKMAWIIVKCFGARPSLPSRGWNVCVRVRV